MSWNYETEHKQQIILFILFGKMKVFQKTHKGVKHAVMHAQNFVTTKFWAVTNLKIQDTNKSLCCVLQHRPHKSMRRKMRNTNEKQE